MEEILCNFRKWVVLFVFKGAPHTPKLILIILRSIIRKENTKEISIFYPEDLLLKETINYIKGKRENNFSLYHRDNSSNRLDVWYPNRSRSK